jgi:hypothetical protein
MTRTPNKLYIRQFGAMMIINDQHLRMDTLGRQQIHRRRRFSPGDLTVKETMRQSVADGMLAPRDVLPLRPLGEHPVFLRRQCHAELASAWRATDETRLLCPPTDLQAAVVPKLKLTRAPAFLLMPDWPRQSWHQAALDLSTKMHRLPLPPADVWTGTRRLNPAWRLLMLDINLL